MPLFYKLFDRCFVGFLWSNWDYKALFYNVFGFQVSFRRSSESGRYFWLVQMFDLFLINLFHRDQYH